MRFFEIIFLTQNMWLVLLLCLLPGSWGHGNETHNDAGGNKTTSTMTNTSTLYPGHIPCPSHQYQCGNGQCVSRNNSMVVCDGFPDCIDGSDESRCGEIECKMEERACDNFTKCVRQSHICDGIVDCNDEQDEMDCENTKCGMHEFRCSSGNCISKEKVCDGRWDCRNGIDEIDCDNGGHRACTSLEFACGNGTCHPMGMMCNGVKDCEDGRDENEDYCMKCMTNWGYETVFRCNGIQKCQKGVDEHNCESCRSGSIKCASNDSCVHPSHICDGFYDCPDMSDEINCTCKEGMFRCNDGSCIEKKQVCDTYGDCPNSEDEEDSMCREKCGSGMYQCNYGRCINTTKVCDGVVDCVLGEDESSDFCGFVGVCIEDKHFNCHMTGKCIFKEWRCDGEVDCLYGEDERGCEHFKCNKTDFKCPNEMKCIDEEMRCDGKGDCQDFSDELGCIFQQSYSSMVFAQRGSHYYHLCWNAFEKTLCNYMSLGSSKRELDLNKLSSNNFAIVTSPNFFGSKNIGRNINITKECTRGPFSVNCSQIQKESCAMENVMHGVYKQKTSWPEVLMLSNGTNFTQCGASWNGPNKIITSADCLKKANISRANHLVLNWSERMENVFVHPKFDPITKKNDLAVIFSYNPASPPFSRSREYPTLCFPGVENLFYVTCQAMAEIDPEDGVNKKHMASVRVKLLTQKECIQAVNRTRAWSYFPVVEYIDYENFICAEYLNQNIGNRICQAPAGYPLACMRSDGNWEQVGLSVKHPANEACRVGIFTNLRKQLDFIYP